MIRCKEIVQKIVIILLFTFPILSCNSRESATAKIFERKHTNDNKLMIKYQFNVGNEQFLDSAIVEHTVIESDTITVSFDKNSPQNSNPELKK